MKISKKSDGFRDSVMVLAILIIAIIVGVAIYAYTSPDGPFLLPSYYAKETVEEVVETDEAEEDLVDAEEDATDETEVVE